MTDPVRRCPDHGPFPGDACPACGAAGVGVLAGDRRRRLSKFLSGALRHFPDDVGLTLDERGWTTWRALLDAAANRYGWADEAAVEAVVATDPKGRFERDGDRVRAAYGHSVDVALEAHETPVPDVLHHGTAPGNLDAIRAEGLRPMGRQQVHLSETVAEARAVGRRHAADPVVLRVDAAGLAADGHRVVKRGRGVYTVDRVPPAYVAVESDR
ncbi:MAG: RNA 2'-phosphotransferase [Haloferacaceae archaeon]